MSSSVPLLRIPEALPRSAVAVGAMILLAGLDLVGALLARRWANGGSATWFAGGLACFALLFWVYGSSLRYAELVPVTFGWLVALQLGLLLINRIGSSRPVPVGHWFAAIAMVALEGYLIYSSDA